MTVPKLASPAQVLLIAVHLCAAVVLLSVWAVSRFPEFGVSFETGAPGQVRVMAGDKPIADLAATDIVTFRQGKSAVSDEAAHLRASYLQIGGPGRLAAWYADRTELTRMARAGPVQLETPAGGWILSPRTRDLSAAPIEFWLLLSGGSLALLCGVWAWAFRPSDAGARFYGLAAVCLFASTCAAAVYDAREVAANGSLLWAMTTVNYLASQLNAWLGVAVFMVFPKPLIRPRLWHLLLVFAIVAAAAAGPAFFNLKLIFASFFFAYVVTLVLIVLQWRAARIDPLARAAMAWMGMSTALALSLGAVILILPRLGGGEQVVAPGFVIIPILIGYGGIAIGVGRYRLFDLDRWAYRLIATAVSALALLLLDAGLIYVLHVQPPAALGITLGLVAIFYLPFRSALWRLMAVKVAAVDGQLFQAAAEVAFTPGLADRRAAWRDLLTGLFEALEIEPATDEVAVPRFQAQGLELVIPATAGESALVLRYAGQGRRLFHAAHVKLAKELIAFMDKAEAARDSYRRGVMEERGRIAQDLHDDVGARLLSSLHRPDVEQVRADVRSAMDDIRVIVGGMAGDQILASRMVADLRNETADRLEDAGIDLDWPPPDTSAPDRSLDFWVYKNVRSAHREVVSNVLRHAQASHVKGSARIEGEPCT